MRFLTDTAEIDTVRRLTETGTMTPFPVPEFVEFNVDPASIIVDGEPATFDELSERKNGGYRIAALLHNRTGRRGLPQLVQIWSLPSLRRNLLFQTLSYLEEQGMPMVIWSTAEPTFKITSGNGRVHRGADAGYLARGVMAVGGAHAARIGTWHAYTFNYPEYYASQTGV